MEKNWGVTELRFRDIAREKYPDFKKLGLRNPIEFILNHFHKTEPQALPVKK